MATRRCKPRVKLNMTGIPKYGKLTGVIELFVEPDQIHVLIGDLAAAMHSHSTRLVDLIDIDAEGDTR